MRKLILIKLNSYPKNSFNNLDRNNKNIKQVSFKANLGSYYALMRMKETKIKEEKMKKRTDLIANLDSNIKNKNSINQNNSQGQLLNLNV